MTETQRIKVRAQQKAWRRDLTNKRCGCGQKAIKRDGDGFVCQRCMDMEARLAKVGLGADFCGIRRERTKIYDVEDKTPLVGDSLKILERMLAAA
jgi:hypothetical protein